MKYGESSCETYFIRFERGEDFETTLLKFCKDKNIKNAIFQGIGSMDDVTLAHYNLEKKKFKERVLVGANFEVVSLMGNITDVDGKPWVHSHIVISDDEMQTYAGHLEQGIVSATLELTLKVYKTEYAKKLDPEIGLRLWDLPDDLV